MATELLFIYDTHCPWSYATTQLVNEIAQAYPDIAINLLHCGRYQGDDNVTTEQLNSVVEDTNIKFTTAYQATLAEPADSTMAANILAWTQNKNAQASLPLLNAIQKAIFDQGETLATKEQLEALTKELKLSPPAKTFTVEKFTKDAEQMLQDVEELQEIIQTNAIPALLLVVNDELVLLNHNLYLKQPSAIIEAIALELK